MKHLTAKRRKHLYKVGKALAAALAVYGVLNGQESAALTLLLAALLDVADRKAFDPEV